MRVSLQTTFCAFSSNAALTERAAVAILLDVIRHLNASARLWAASSERKRHDWRQRTMRKSKVETARTRQRIVKAAGAEFAANGISEAALARVMSAAGLTHGGFYRHFPSKDQLVLEACSNTVLSLVANLELLSNGKPHGQALP